MKKYFPLAVCTLICFTAHAQKAVFENRTVLSDSVNSSSDESGLLLSPDGKTLYFVRSFYSGNVDGATGRQDIYYSTKRSEGVWSAATNIGPPLNDEFHNAVCGISSDGKKLYLNAIKLFQDRTNPGISVSTLTEEGWSLATPLTTFKFPEKGFFQGFVSPDEDYIIVSFEGETTKGLEDLYVLKKGSDGTFGEPVSLGDKINTSGFETNPVMSLDSKTLYFSSNGLGGSGDGDIFKSTRLDDSWTNWSQPENLGTKINTNGFDGSFVVDQNKIAYYISGEGASGSGNVYTIDLNPPPPPPAPPVAPAPELVIGLPAPPESVDTFGHALFAFNSVIVNPESKESLLNVVKKLKKNKAYRIQVEGHTDSKGSEVYNQRLSEKRALSVKTFLTKNGISPSKIKTQGFGELNPISENETEEGRAMNRRVEVKYFIK